MTNKTNNIMRVTDKELAVLKAFADNEYTAMSGMYQDREIMQTQWMFIIRDYSYMTGNEFSGVVSSLVQKGWVRTNTDGDRGMFGVAIRDTWTMEMTDDGFDALNRAIK